MELRLAQRVEAERKRLEAEQAKLDAEADQLLLRAAKAEAELPEISRAFEEKIAGLQRERDRQVADLRLEAESLRRDAEAVRVRRDSLPSVSAKSLDLLAEDLGRERSDLGAWLERRTQGEAEIRDARQATVVSAGAAAVAEYEEIRRRLEGAADAVERRAYALAENASRAGVARYADALDYAAALDAGRLPILILAPGERDGRVVLIAPVPPTDADSGHPRWRIATMLFEAAERAGREMDADVTVGSTYGCLAVDLRPWGGDPDLLEISLLEAWEARPSLAAAGLALWRELVPGISPPFEEVDFEVEGIPARGDPEGGEIQAVARRLAIPLPDLIASLVASGLPFPDDVMDAGVEASLRSLLHLEQEEPVASLAPPAPGPAPVDHSTPPAIARRILAKLLRDQRIGGRHTNVGNVWGHHFADNEKDVARAITERLIRAGILISKSKPGGQHVSIDPRRMGDVRRIIELTAPDQSLFEGLD